MTLKPLSNRILIEPVEDEKTTKSGIIIPRGEDKRGVRGTVIAVGPGKFDEDGEKRIPVSVKVGDMVIFKKYGPDEIEVDDKKYLIGDDDDILAIIE